MEAKEKAMILEIGEAAEWNRKVIWMEMRETDGVIPVTYHSERRPFLRFDAEERAMMIEVRAEYYGKTWRCWTGGRTGSRCRTGKAWRRRTVAAGSGRPPGRPPGSGREARGNDAGGGDGLRDPSV